MPESGSKPSTVPSSEQILDFFFGAIQMISCRARLVTMDETWLYQYDSETKQQSVEWRHSGSPRPQQFWVQKSAGKVLALIFWNQDDILLIYYLPKGRTMNAEYYLSLLVQLKDILKEKRREKFTKGILFLHDNVPTHRTLATQKKLVYLGFQFLDHPPILRIWSRRTTTCSLDWKTFFFRRRGHCCRGDLVGRKTSLFFF